jgi:hypothetical protein
MCKPFYKGQTSQTKKRKKQGVGRTEKKQTLGYRAKKGIATEQPVQRDFQFTRF